MERILEKKYFVIGGIIIILGVLGVLYFVINRSTDGYTNLSETKEVEEKETSGKDIIMVEVKGEVANPGVYTLKEDTIINELINQAGGLTKDAYTDNINLSKKLKDEMVVIIYKKSDFGKKVASKVVSQTSKVTSTTKSNITSDTCGTSTSDITACTDNKKSVIEVNENSSDTTSSSDVKSNISTSSASKIVNINTATLSELMTLNGIGESKAKKIIEYREKNKFVTPQDITKVSGIGNSTYENIKEHITV